MSTREVKAKQVIFYQGEVPKNGFKINKGLVRAYSIHSDGSESTIAYFGDGQIFPLGVLLQNVPVAMFFYEAVTDTSLVEVTLSEVLTQDETAAERIKELASHLLSSFMHIYALSQTSARLRIACMLRLLALNHSERLLAGKLYKLRFKLTQEDISNLCGLSRETCNIELRSLRSNDILMVKSKYYIIDLVKLNKFIGDENGSLSNP